MKPRSVCALLIALGLAAGEGAYIKPHGSDQEVPLTNAGQILGLPAPAPGATPAKPAPAATPASPAPAAPTPTVVAEAASARWCARSRRRRRRRCKR